MLIHLSIYRYFDYIIKVKFLKSPQFKNSQLNVKNAIKCVIFYMFIGYEII